MKPETMFAFTATPEACCAALRAEGSALAAGELRPGLGGVDDQLVVDGEDAVCGGEASGVDATLMVESPAPIGCVAVVSSGLVEKASTGE